MKKTKDFLCVAGISIVASLIVSSIFYFFTIKSVDKKVEKAIAAMPVPTCVPSPTPMPTPTPAPTSTPIPTPTPTPEPIVTHPFASTYSLYTEFNEADLELLFRVIEAEVTGGTVETKANVASVIFNRLEAGWWNGDLRSNLLARNQFEVITNGRYKTVEITESTIIACEKAFKGDTAQGALFFDSTDGKSWAAGNRTFLFRDKAGHNFYK